MKQETGGTEPPTGLVEQGLRWGSSGPNKAASSRRSSPDASDSSPKAEAAIERRGTITGPHAARWTSHRKQPRYRNAHRLEGFERYFESIGKPFECKFTRADLSKLIGRMRTRYWEAGHLKMAA